MNKTIKMEFLHDLSNTLDVCNTLNMYSTLFIIIFGCVGNLWALIVLVSSRNNLPRIMGSNYLILLTVTNTIYLFLQFYMATYIRIIQYFNLDYRASLQFFDSSLLVCKTMTYLRYSTRLLNATITVCFSIERMLAVYWPLRIRSLDLKSSLFFKASMIVSFLIPSYSIYYFELVPSDAANKIHSSLNITRTFNLKAVVPSMGDYSCSTKKVNFKLALKLHFIMFLLVFVAYLVVSISIFAIIMKLKATKRFIFEYRSNKNSFNSTFNSEEKTQRRSERAESLDLMRTEEDCAVYPPVTSRLSADIKAKSSSIKMLNVRKRVRLINHKIHDTKILSSVSISFVLLNTPYLISMLYLLIYALNVDDHTRLSPQNMAAKFRLNIYIVVAEIFQLVNFSVTGFLFYFSGKIFRMHASKLFRKLILLFR